MTRYSFYRVGKQRFSNKFMAFLHAQRTSQRLEFDFFESAFDTADWSQEPQTSWNHLLDLRAQQIANLKRPIILAFSGGTDSLTMYEVFKRNNIKIDAVFLKIKDDAVERSMYENVLKFLDDERRAQRFKVMISNEDHKFLDHIYESPDWWQNDLPIRVQFSVATGLQDIESISGYDNSVPTDFVFVVGLDKPRVRLIDGVFYSYLQDTTFLNYCDPRNEYFFCSPDLPELHVKQSYMLANYVLRHSRESSRELSDYDRVHDPRHFDYLDYSINGCGRFGDIANSQQQKIMNRYCQLYVTDHKIIYEGRSQAALLSGLADGSVYARNYIDGLRAMRSDSCLSKIFRDPENYYSVIDIDSKLYALSMNTDQHHA